MEELNMKIGNNGETQFISFWPAKDIDAAFKSMKAAMGKKEEVQEMRAFIKRMFFYYEIASYVDGDLSPGEASSLYDFAIKGLNMEIDAERKTA
jgi:hypothetical protein